LLKIEKIERFCKNTGFKAGVIKCPPADEGKK